MKLLFCILHFCILGQTEKNGYTVFLEMKRKDDAWEKYSMMVLMPRQGNLRLVFRLFVLYSAKPRIRLNNLKTCLRFPCLGLNTIIDSINLTSDPSRIGSNLQRWDDEPFKALNVSVFNPSAACLVFVGDITVSRPTKYCILIIVFHYMYFNTIWFLSPQMIEISSQVWQYVCRSRYCLSLVLL